VIEPWQMILGAIITVIGSVLAARVAGRASVKVKELDVDGQAYLRAEGITANLIKQLEASIVRIEAARDEDNRDYETRLQAIEKRLGEVSRHNDALTTFVYILVAILRRHGLLEEINSQDVPDGIRV
jgi:hypothetical protein